MLIYLNGIPLQGNTHDARVQSALPLSRIVEVTEVEQIPQFGNKWVFSIRLDDGQIICSEPCEIQQEAEMHQLSTVSQINALGVYEHRLKCDLPVSNIACHYVDITKKQLIQFSLDPLYPVFTIKI